MQYGLIIASLTFNLPKQQIENNNFIIDRQQTYIHYIKIEERKDKC